MTDFETEGVSDDMLMALADGELEQAQAEALRARIESDPSLAARYAVFTDTAEALRAAFAQPEIPAHLVDAVERAGESTPSGDAVVVPFRRRTFAWPAALAASLAIGLGLGWVLNGSAPHPVPGLQDAAQAVSALPTGEARQVAGLGDIRVLGSFETGRGLCRLIALQPDSGNPSRIVACRADGGWDIALSVSDGAGGDYAPASSTGTEMLDLFLDSIGAGPALAPEAEAEHLN